MQRIPRARPAEKIRRFWVVLTFAPVCLACCCLSGCGDGRPKRVPVAGQVLIDGKPLSFGYIGFIPEHDRPSIAKLDEQGRFTMNCFEDGDGVVVGKHAIEIMAQESIGQEKLKWHAPKKYANSKTSGIAEEISAPTDSLTIQLTWDGQPGPFIEVMK